MNPYQFESECSVCGGPGVATARGAAAAWVGQSAHTDPRVCRDVLAARARKLEEKEKQS